MGEMIEPSMLKYMYINLQMHNDRYATCMAYVLEKSKIAAL